MAKASMIGNIHVALGLDSAQFQRGLQNSTSRLNKFGKDAETFGARLKQSLAGFAGFGKAFSAGLATAAVGAVGSILSVAGALAKAKEAMREFSKTADVSARLGVPAEKLQELRFAAEQSGMAVDNFDVAFRRFIRRSSEAAKGTGAAKDAFKELGIQLLDSDGRLKQSDKLLGEVADALQKVQNPADKLRLAFKLFDTDGAAMVNVLAKGSAGLDDFARKARQLGLVVDEHLIQRSAELQTEFETASRVLDMQFKQALVNLAPVLVGVAERASRLAGDIRSLVDAMLDLENRSSTSLDGRMRSLGLERLDVEKRILELQRERADLSDNARDLGFHLDTAGANQELTDLEQRLAAIAAEEERILKILQDRKPSIAPLPDTPPVLPPPGGGGRNAAAAAALREAEAVRELIDNLAHELSLVYESDLEKAKANALRQAGAAATDDQRRQIEALVTAIHEETEALKANDEAQKARAQGIENLFKMGEDALLSMIDNSISAEEAMKRLALQIAKAALQAALFGSGPLGGLFKADGGIIKAASGGMIRGPGGPRDDKIPALLSNGEFVVNAKATKQWGGLLKRINDGLRPNFDALTKAFELPQYRLGGFVMPPMSERGGELIIGECS